MTDSIIQSLQTYYGLDWMTMILGMVGSFMISSQNAKGFLFSILACCCGFTVAWMSGQFGFVVHNIVITSIAVRGYLVWTGRLNVAPQNNRQNHNKDIVLDAAE